MNTPNSRIAAFAGIAIVAVAAYTLRDKGNATLTRWIDAGAVWPDGIDAVKLADPREHWSFKVVSALAEVPPEIGLKPKLLSINQFITTKRKESTELLARTHDDHIN